MSKIQIPASVAFLAGEEITASRKETNYKKHYKDDIKRIQKGLKALSKLLDGTQKEINNLKLTANSIDEEILKLSSIGIQLKKTGSMVGSSISQLGKDLKVFIKNLDKIEKDKEVKKAKGSVKEALKTATKKKELAV